MTEADLEQTETLPLAPRRVLAALPKSALLPEILWLAIPVLAENVLHMWVGLNDTYLASHLPDHAADATAAIGLVTYVIWLIGLIGGAIATGSTAIIARAVGAKHQRLANSVCGQSVTAAVLAGLVTMIVVALFAGPITRAIGVRPGNPAMGFSIYYLRILGLSLPFLMLMIAANACLRGAGDSVTPAVAMIVVDVVNIVLSFALTRGWYGLPVMGFRGIAIGTVIAYMAGGVLQFVVLIAGRGKIRLFLHRLRLHWTTMRRVLRIGVPNGIEGIVVWVAQFAILGVIFQIDASNVSSAAHIITIRIESLSFMAGLAFATAAATVVGQSLGMRDPARARHAAYISFALGGGVMIFGGICFLLFRHQLAHILSDDPRIAGLSAACLFITAFSQPGFAASIIFGSALRGAGDTLVVMIINLASIIALRLIGVSIVTLVFHHGLQAVWIVLAAELSFRGFLMFARFNYGAWASIEV